MMHFLRPLSLALAVSFTPAFGQHLDAPEAQIAPRIVDRIDDSRLTPLKDSHPPLALSRYDRGQVDPTLSMGDLFLVLHRAPEVQKAFDAFVASQYDPTSPNFHQWLTADQIGERFGPAPADIQNLSAWLQSHGFSVDDVSRDRISIRFSGSAQQVQSAFHTEIHTFDVKGSPHLANITDASIPTALIPVVTGVRGLHNFFPRPLHRLGQRVTRDAETGAWQRTKSAISPLQAPISRPKPLFGTTDTYGDVIEDVAPYDFAAIYNVLPLWQQTSPIDGTGQTIAIAGTSNINLADVAAFRTAFGLPTSAAVNTPKVIVTNSDPGACSNFADTCFGDLIENTLDVEWSGAVARGASIVLVTSAAPTATTDALYLSESYIVQNKTASIMNVSYGGCELILGNSGNAQYSSLWQTAAAEGISVIVSAGDAGSAMCDQDVDATAGVPYAAQFGLAVNGIASTPYNTAVGGTDLNWGSAAAPYWNATNSSTTAASALGYIPEIPWNSTCTNPLIFSTLAGDASALGVTPVTDAESSCNFVVNNFSSIDADYGVQLDGLVDTIGGGGGVSNCTSSNEGYVGTCSGGYPKPSWQTGIAGIPADGLRDIPDVSFFASDGFLGSSYLICVTGAGACTYSALAEPTAQEVGGTSVASPAMAGIMALIDQKAGAAQGNPNPTLYTLAAGQTYSACSSESATASGACLFNDIDTGTIAMACDAGSPNCTTDIATDAAGVLSGFAAGAGYDLATGLGSLNVTNVVNKWPLSTAALVTLSPTSLAFPSTVAGFPSAAKTFTLTNSGKSALSITGFSFTGTNASSFSQTNNCPASLAAAAACTISVIFKPTVAGSLTASVSVADNAFDTPQTVALTGTATAPAPSASFSADSINYGSTAVGATNTATATLTNSGTASLTLTSITVTGTNATSFLQTNTCGTSVAAGASCTVTITFKPVVSGSLTANLQAVDNAANSPQTIALSGTATGGSSPLTFSPSAVTFASTPVGNTATQVITLKNTGASAVTFTSATTITGNNASVFSKSASTCPNPLPAGASCTNTISFTPLTTGTLTATVTYSDTASGSPQTVALSGTGGAAGASTLTFSPGSLIFASTTTGTTATQVITIKNTSASPATFTSATTITGTNASAFVKSASTCPNPLLAGASCTNTISFTPTIVGTLTATVTYTDTAAGSPQTVALSGTGAAPLPVLTFSPSAVTFASTPVGNTATQVITLKNTGATSVTFTSATTITGTNASTFVKSASTCPNPLAAGASCTNTISFTPLTTGTLTATVTYTDTAAGGTQTVALSGTGGPAGASTLTFSPGSLIFASTTTGTTATQVITIKNTGASPATFTSATTITGPNASAFAKSASTCPNPLLAGASCTNTISFTPTVAGTLTATVTYTDTAAGSPQIVALSGTGVAPVPVLTFSPSALTFASTPVGNTAIQVITLKNTGATSVTFTSATTITGTNASAYVKSASTCPNPLLAGASCTNTISFTPLTTGTLTATVTYTDTAANTHQTVALSGTGGAPGASTLTFSPGSLIFASTAVGTTATQVITIKNTSTSSATFTSATTITGTNASAFVKSASSCPNPLLAGASCTNTISFTPTTTGAFSATVTYTDTAAGSPQTVALSGTGH